MIQPRRRDERDPTKLDAKNKPFQSCYFEEGGDGKTFLEEGGYDTFPAYVPRWDVLSGDVYGRSPGMDHLGDIKQLQQEQKRKAQAIDKMVNPPMVAPTSLRGRPTTVIPGGTTYVDATQGNQGFVPAYQVPRIDDGYPRGARAHWAWILRRPFRHDDRLRPPTDHGYRSGRAP